MKKDELGGLVEIYLDDIAAYNALEDPERARSAMKRLSEWAYRMGYDDGRRDVISESVTHTQKSMVVT